MQQKTFDDWTPTGDVTALIGIVPSVIDALALQLGI